MQNLAILRAVACVMLVYTPQVMSVLMASTSDIGVNIGSMTFLSSRQGSKQPWLSGDFTRDSSNPLDVYEDKGVTTPPPSEATGKAEAKDVGNAKAKDAGAAEDAGGDEDLVKDTGAGNATENSTTAGGVQDVVAAKDTPAAEDAGGTKKHWKYCMYLSTLLFLGCCCFSGAAHSNLGQIMAGFFNFILPFVVILYVCDTTNLFWDWWDGKPICDWCRLICIWAFIQISFGIFCLGCSILGIGAATTVGQKTMEEKRLEKDARRVGRPR